MNKINFTTKLWAVGAAYLFLMITIQCIANDGKIIINANKFGEMWIDLIVFSSFMVISLISLVNHIIKDRKERRSEDGI